MALACAHRLIGLSSLFFARLHAFSHDSCVDLSARLRCATYSPATGPAFASLIRFISILSSCAFPDRLSCALREGRWCAAGDHACSRPFIVTNNRLLPIVDPLPVLLLGRWSHIRYRQAGSPGRGYKFPCSKAGACMATSGDVSSRWCSVGYLHVCLRHVLFLLVSADLCTTDKLLLVMLDCFCVRCGWVGGARLGACISPSIDAYTRSLVSAGLLIIDLIRFAFLLLA